MNRRGFLGQCLLLAAAPAIVRADALMRIVPRETTFITFVSETGWIDVLRYDALRQVHADDYPDFPGEIGRYESFRFIRPSI